MSTGISLKAAFAGIATVGILFISTVIVAAIVSGSFTTGSSSNVTITQLPLGKPASATVGDILIATVANRGGTASTVTPPTGWTLILRTDKGGNIGVLSYWKVVGASEPSSYTWTITPATNAAGGITAYGEVDTVNPIDVSGGHTGLSTIAIAPSITTTAANDEIITVFAAPSTATTFSTPAGMTEKYDTTRAMTGPSLASDEALQAVAGASGTKSSVISGRIPRNWVAQQIALRQQSSSPIAFDTAAQIGGANPSVSITRGTGASNYIGLATVACLPVSTVSVVAWGGNAMTQLMDETGPDGNHEYWYYILNPPSGVQTVSAATGGNCQLGALTYSGVSQTAPFDSNFDGASNSYVKNLNTAVPDNTELTTTGTTHVDDSYAVLTFDWQTSVAPGTNATERLDHIVYDRGSVTHPAGTVSIGVLNDSGGDEAIAGFMIALQPAN